MVFPVHTRGQRVAVSSEGVATALAIFQTVRGKKGTRDKADLLFTHRGKGFEY